MFKRAKIFLTAEERVRIEAAIAVAERETSGEIRIHLQTWAWGHVNKAAEKAFKRLGMTRTKERNGILFFIVTGKHQFAILGDRGIHAKVGQAFWDGLRDTLQTLFHEGKCAEALSRAVLRCGEELKRYFPHQADDVNELSNTLSVD